MTRILITSFEPFGGWSENASSLAVTRFERDYRGPAEIMIRQYPVEFQQVRRRLTADIESSLDAVVLTGQSSRARCVELEWIALNVHSDTDEPAGPFFALDPDAPLARQTTLPLDNWCQTLNQSHVPARVSHHAGTYLCNAAYYYALGISQSLGTPPVAFVHFPLTPEQRPQPRPGGRPLETSQSALAIELIVAQLTALFV